MVAVAGKKKNEHTERGRIGKDKNSKKKKTSRKYEYRITKHGKTNREEEKGKRGADVGKGKEEGGGKEEREGDGIYRRERE